jgi:hypothetical protein
MREGLVAGGDAGRRAAKACRSRGACHGEVSSREAVKWVLMVELREAGFNEACAWFARTRSAARVAARIALYASRTGA